MNTSIDNNFINELHLAKNEFRFKSIDRSWIHLERAHVLGQMHFFSHLKVHLLMLVLAFKTRDVRECLGQAFRILLVPIGHIVGRVPVGNTGRSNVSAFQQMPVPEDLKELLRKKP